jgi:hypothetical protein
MAAQFTADLSPKSNAMSLGDMMKIGLYSAETEIANRKAQIAAEQQKELPLIQSVMADPENKLSDGSYDTKKLTQILPAIAPLTGPEYATKIVNMTKNHIESSKSLNELSQQERGIIGSVYAAHAQAGTQDPNQVIASLNALRTENPNLDRLVGLKIDALKQIPGGPEFNKKLYQARNETLTPTQVIDQFAPKATPGEIGGQKVGIVTTPSLLGEKPTISTSPLGGGTPAQTTGGMQPTGSMAQKTRVMPDLIKEDPDFNYTGPANPLNLSDVQKDSYAKGKAMLRDAPTLAMAAQEGKQDVRKVEEVAYKASGTGAYKTAQDWGRIVIAQPDLDVLRKNISRVMVQNANTMGLNASDKSRADAATISGSDAISPEALRDIMQRADAQFTATTKFSQGLAKYREKRGEVNSALNADRFQSAWASNYDSRIFQLQNIRDSNYPEAVKKQRYESLTKSMSEKEFDELDKKAKVIDRLVEGSYK